MVKKKCNYGDCINNALKSPGITFFRFPNPKKDQSKCIDWIKASGLNSAAISQFEYSKTPKYVCSEHFIEGRPTHATPNPISLQGKVMKVFNRRTVIKDNPGLLVAASSCVSTNSDVSSVNAPVHITELSEEANAVNDEAAKTSTDSSKLETSCQDVHMRNAEKPTSSEEIVLFENSPNEQRCGITNEVESLNQSTNVEAYHASDKCLETHGSKQQKRSLTDCSVPAYKKLRISIEEPSFTCDTASYSSPVPLNISTLIDVQDCLTDNNETSEEIPCTISTLEKLVGCVRNWRVEYSDECALYSIIKGNYVVLTLKVDKEMKTSLEALGKEVESHSVQNVMKSSIFSPSDVLECLQALGSLNLCQGCPKDEFKLIENKIGSGAYCIMTDAFHSSSCSLFVEKAKIMRTNRCDKCTRYRKILKTTLWRQQNPRFTAKKRLSTLTKKELVSSLKKVKKREKYSSKRAKLLKQKIRREIRNQGHMISKNDSELLESILKANIDQEDNFSQVFLQQQLTALRVKNSKSRRWHPKVIKWCLLLHSKSPSAYDCIRKTNALQLPCRKTLYSYALPMTAQPGFTEQSFKILVQQMQDLKLFDEEHTKYVMLLIDEMKVKEDLIYKRTTGDLVGFVDLGETLNELRNLDKLSNPKEEKIELATNVLQFMVKGITSKVKHSLAFFPCNRLKSNDLTNLIWEAVEKLEVRDIRVLVVIGDGASTNRSFFKQNVSLGNSDGKILHSCTNTFRSTNVDADRPLFFIFDPPHLLKTARNNLESSEISSEKRILKKNQKHLFWAHVTKLYYKDCHRIPRKYPRLKFSHVKLNSYGKMRVKFAVQVLSASVANGLEMEIGDEASETVAFIRLMNRFFDVVNGTNFKKAYFSRMPDLKPYQFIDDNRLKWLETEFIQYFEDWENEVESLTQFTKKQKKMMLLTSETSEGLKFSALSIVGVIRFMLSKGAKYVCAGKLNQDPLEQEFSKHRSLCGANTNPTVAQYGQTVGKIRILRGLVPETVGGNTSLIK